LPPTYDELGIGKVQAARWQAEARVTKHPGGDPRDTPYQDVRGGCRPRLSTMPRWPAAGAERYERGQYEAALEALPFEYQTLRNDKAIAQEFELSRRRDNLTWKHHAEVAGEQIERAAGKRIGGGNLPQPDTLASLLGFDDDTAANFG